MYIPRLMLCSSLCTCYAQYMLVVSLSAMLDHVCFLSWMYFENYFEIGRFSFDPTAKLGLDVASCIITRYFSSLLVLCSRQEALVDVNGHCATKLGGYCH